MPKSTLGRLDVIIGANIEGLTKGLNSASKGLQSFSTSAIDITKGLSKITIAAGAAGAAITAMVATSATAARELKTLSQLSGVTVEAFQRQAFAAKTVGFEQEKLADIYKDARERVGDFLATGGGPLLDFFEQVAPKIGVTANEFRNLSGPEVLLKLQQSMEKANLSYEKQIFYMEAMASDASRLIPLLKDNAAEFQNFGAEAEKTGAILDAIEVEKLRIAGDQLQMVGKVISGVKDQIALQFAPLITAMGEAFISSGINARSFGNAVATAIDIAGAAIEVVRKAAIGLEALFIELTIGVSDFVINSSNKLNSFAEASAKFWSRILPGEREPRTIFKVIAEDAQFMKEGAQDALMDLVKDLENYETVSEKIEEIRRRNQDMAEAAAIAFPAVPNVGDGGDDGDPLAKKRAEQYEIQLEQLREFLRTEEESINASYERRLEQLALFHESGVLGEQEYGELKEKLAKDTAKRLEQLEQRSHKARLQGAANFAGNLSTLLQAGSEEQFGIAKVAAVASALLNQREAILGAYKWGAKIGGPPMGAAAAGVAAAATAVQVGAIKSASLGGGVSSVGAGVGSATQVTEAPSTNFLDIGISGIGAGQLFSGEQVRELISAINDEIADGAVIRSVRLR